MQCYRRSLHLRPPYAERTKHFSRLRAVTRGQRGKAFYNCGDAEFVTIGGSSLGPRVPAHSWCKTPISQTPTGRFKNPRRISSPPPHTHTQTHTHTDTHTHTGDSCTSVVAPACDLMVICECSAMADSEACRAYVPVVHSNLRRLVGRPPQKAERAGGRKGERASLRLTQAQSSVTRTLRYLRCSRSLFFLTVIVASLDTTTLPLRRVQQRQFKGPGSVKLPAIPRRRHRPRRCAGRQRIGSGAQDRVREELRGNAGAHYGWKPVVP